MRRPSDIPGPCELWVDHRPTAESFAQDDPVVLSRALLSSILAVAPAPAKVPASGWRGTPTTRKARQQAVPYSYLPGRVRSSALPHAARLRGGTIGRVAPAHDPTTQESEHCIRATAPVHQGTTERVFHSLVGRCSSPACAHSIRHIYHTKHGFDRSRTAHATITCTHSAPPIRLHSSAAGG